MPHKHELQHVIDGSAPLREWRARSKRGELCAIYLCWYTPGEPAPSGLCYCRHHAFIGRTAQQAVPA